MFFNSCAGEIELLAEVFCSLCTYMRVRLFYMCFEVQADMKQHLQQQPEKTNIVEDSRDSSTRALIRNLQLVLSFEPTLA